MQQETPKPFIEIEGQPILAHTVRRFLALAGLQQIVIATSAESIARCEAIMEAAVGAAVPWQCVEGGAERQHSVRLGLEHVEQAAYVLVHDAVRPFVTPDAIMDCCREAEQAGAAVLGLPSKDTIKQVGADRFVEQTPDRSRLWQVQTPQVFEAALLRRAHRRARDEGYLGTDDASLVEWLGEPVRMVRGSADNIKITYPRDLDLARILMGERTDQPNRQ